MDWSHPLKYLLRRSSYLSVHIGESLAGRNVAAKSRYAAMACSQGRTVLYPDGRFWCIGRLLSSRPSNPGGSDHEDDRFQEDWCINAIHDGRPVSDPKAT